MPVEDASCAQHSIPGPSSGIKAPLLPYQSVFDTRTAQGTAIRLVPLDLCPAPSDVTVVTAGILGALYPGPTSFSKSVHALRIPLAIRS